MRGFPVEIDVEEGENDAGENIFDDDDLDSGAVPTTPPKSDQGSDREQAPKEAQGLQLMRELHQVLVIRMIRMIRMGRIRTIRINGISPNWKETFFAKARTSESSYLSV